MSIDSESHFFKRSERNLQLLNSLCEFSVMAILYSTADESTITPIEKIERATIEGHATAKGTVIADKAVEGLSPTLLNPESFLLTAPESWTARRRVQ